MSSTPAGPPATAPPQTTGAKPEVAAPIDWRALAQSPGFQALHASRRRFTMIGLAIETAALFVVMGLYGFAADSMGKPAIGSITWALVSGAGLIVLTFVMASVYAAKARSWEKLAERAVAQAEPTTEPSRRFER